MLASSDDRHSERRTRSHGWSPDSTTLTCSPSMSDCFGSALTAGTDGGGNTTLTGWSELANCQNCVGGTPVVNMK